MSRVTAMTAEDRQAWHFFATVFAKLNGDERKEALAELGVESARPINIYTMPPPAVGTIAPLKQLHEESAEMKELRTKAALADKYKEQIAAALEREAEEEALAAVDKGARAYAEKHNPKVDLRSGH